LAIGLDAVTGFDAADPANGVLQQQAVPRFVEGLRTASLRNTRIGVLTEYMSLILFSDDLLDIFDRSSDVTDDRGNTLLTMLQNTEEGREARNLVVQALERMKELGAEIVDVSIPKLDSLLTGSSVIDHEFKFDLQDYLAAAPTAPIDSLGDILIRGLYHPGLEAILRRTNAPQSRDTEAYRRALARRQEVRDTVLAWLARERLDAIAYPTMRREAATIGQRQRGSTCQLSAATGLPAISIPAGYTSAGLPVGIELLGGPLEDAKLVGFAFVYEQAYHPRHPPASTPSLLVGR
jgi:Asp-tRNA(Asn)/Glu-tRNA(Gln) amidotransferase A subunit family amidase